MLGIVVVVLIAYSCWKFWSVNTQLRDAKYMYSVLRQEEGELRHVDEPLCSGYSAEGGGY